MNFLDAKYEPVRRYIYGVAVALVAVGVVFSVVTAEAAVAITAVLAAACLVPAAEVARSKVTPVDEAHPYDNGRHAAL